MTPQLRGPPVDRSPPSVPAFPARALRAASRPLPALALLALAACGDGPAGPGADRPPELDGPWEVARPAEVGVDPGLLEEARERGREVERLQTLLAVRDGRIVLEAQYRGKGADSLADLRSVTKTVVSTLVGAALHAGLIPDLERTLGELIPPEVAALTPEQEAITLRHLLTMSSGFEWEEDGAVGYNEWFLSGDPVGYLLARPRVHEPGTTFTYNSAAVHLLSVALERAVGTPLPEFARERLFGPLGIHEVRWERMPDGSVNGGSGLDLRPRDLARVGRLFLQDGRSGPARLLPPGWVDEATAPFFPWRVAIEPLERVSYGYLWWLETTRPLDAFFAWGFGGQFLYVVPDLELVVVATTDWRSPGLDAGATARRVLEVIQLVIRAAA